MSTDNDSTAQVRHLEAENARLRRAKCRKGMADWLKNHRALEQESPLAGLDPAAVAELLAAAKAYVTRPKGSPSHAAARVAIVDAARKLWPKGGAKDGDAEKT